MVTLTKRCLAGDYGSPEAGTRRPSRQRICRCVPVRSGPTVVTLLPPRDCRPSVPKEAIEEALWSRVDPRDTTDEIVLEKPDHEYEF